MATAHGQSLARTHLFQRAVIDWELVPDQRLALAHQRAKAIAATLGMQHRFKLGAIDSTHEGFTIEDILTCSEKFWDSNIDPINILDGAATTLWTIHLNLACATVAQFVHKRPDLQELCQKLLAFEVS